MTNGQYNAALSLFFVSYAGFEPLTNILLKRLRPSIFLPAIMILWGICMTCMGLVHNFPGLAAARWFLGMAEAGLFPGVNYVSLYHYCCVPVTSALGELLAD
jgi:MFS family permease